MNALVFGMYFLLLLLCIVVLCAEVLFRLSKKFRFGFSRRDCRVLVVALAALSVAWPIASTLAEWGVSTHTHNIVGSFVLDVLHTHGVGIAIGMIGLMLAGAVATKLGELRRRRPAPFDHDTNIILGE